MKIDFKKEYEIIHRDINKNGKCRITSIMDFLTDVAMRHENSLGIDITPKNQDGVVFVFYDYDIILHSYPKYAERVDVRTHVKSIQKFYATRRYEVYGENGELLVEAEALAVVIDINARKLAKVPDIYYEKHNVDKSIKTKAPRIKLNPIERIDFTGEYNIRYSDMDSYGHINNAKYIDWELDLVPKELLENYKLKELKIKFQKEITDKEQPTVNIEITDHQDGLTIIKHRVLNCKGEEVNAMDSYWERK